MCVHLCVRVSALCTHVDVGVYTGTVSTCVCTRVCVCVACTMIALSMPFPGSGLTPAPLSQEAQLLHMKPV